ncbi:hypothetical protein ES708_03700 [subsurface metagenome]
MKDILEAIKEKAVWTIERYANDEDFKRGKPFDVSEFLGNALLNEGIDEIEKLICTTGATQYNTANAKLGVGDSSAAENASHTGLQAETNKEWKAMDATHPTLGSQVMTFKATFGAAEANFSWQEFTVVNAADDTGKNLNRKVSDQGTKAEGQTWVLMLTITLS